MTSDALRPQLILPDDAAIKSVIGPDNPSHRAYRARLKRAEDAGILPRRVYLSSQRFAYRRVEIEAAMDRLPRAHAQTLREAGRAAAG